MTSKSLKKLLLYINILYLDNFNSDGNGNNVSLALKYHEII